MEYASVVCAKGLLFLVVLLMLAAGASAQGIPYGVGSWPEDLGNQRAHIRVREKADAVRLHIDWRRRDASPESKDIAIIDAATGKRVSNIARVSITRESGDLVFQPSTAPGEYYVYYMPYSSSPVSWAYAVTYSPPSATADPAWLASIEPAIKDTSDERWRSLPEAEVIEIQSRSEFDRPDPMEVIAGAEETRALAARYGDRPYLLFPEDRNHPIRMTDDLPYRWVLNGPSSEFHGEAQRGEFYVFQLGVYASQKPIDGLSVTFSDLRSGQKRVIPAWALRCINVSGKDWLGRPISKNVSVQKGKVQALWFGVQVPPDAVPGDYEGVLTLQPKGLEPSKVSLSLAVSSQKLADSGDSELWRLSRLRWLDSTIGLDDEVAAPYTPLEVHGKTVECLGRAVTFGSLGLPESIKSGRREILAAPMRVVVEDAGRQMAWSAGKSRIISSTHGAVTRETDSSSDGLTLHCWSKMEFDGYINYRITIEAAKPLAAKDIRLEIPFRRDVATYMMGMAREGGYRPKEWKWTWDIDRANNSVWIGDVDAGMQCKLKGTKDSWDIANLRESGLPDSWSNGGKGGCTVTEEGESVVVRAYSGERAVKAGDRLEFRFGLLITPVRPLDPAHWSQRYYHDYVPPEKAVESGASIINIHHGNGLNPYINYPFLTADKLGAYVKRAHDKGVKVKIYYTVRELSNHVAEMWALRSLGSEVFVDGPGAGGNSWLREHLVSHYVPAWHQVLGEGQVDAAIATTGLSRWHNYYLEGLNWLIRNVGIDGLYLDGIGYDREIMKRVRKVMDRAKPGCLIDFHSGNEYVYADMRISPANKYMEHFPYINSLWFGEMYDYGKAPDWWLVEVSGIPFGLYGEMLQDNGNPWRGMVYGMTARYYSGADPKHIWKLWDDFGISDAKMIGYWSPNCPVRTGRDDVLATAYCRKDRVLISVASWAKEPVQCRLSIDWRALGLDPEKARLTAPAITGFQDAAPFKPSDPVPMDPGKGWLLVVQ